MKDVILTGDRPTGKLHLGHYVGSLKRRVAMQNSGNYNDIYIADIQYDWIDKSEIEKETIISEVRDIIFEDGEFALEVMKHINEKIAQFKKEDGHLYAVYGTSPQPEQVCLP